MEYLLLHGNIAIYRVKTLTIKEHYINHYNEEPVNIDDLIDYMKNNMNFNELRATIVYKKEEEFNDFCNWEYAVI